MDALVDTHCHIHAAIKSRNDFTAKKWHEAGEGEPEDIRQDAVAAGVEKLICVGTDLADSKSAVEFVQGSGNCWASVGTHPHDAKDFLAEHNDLSEFEILLKKPKVIAIGEVGLDYYYEHSPKKEQVKLLEMFLQLATESKLPVIFHVREAFADFWPVYRNFSGLKGVLHSFTAGSEELEKALSEGLYIGLNGIMTFTKDEAQLAMAKKVPPHRLLLETDAPYLAPKPFRGKICKPEHVKNTAEFLADLRGENFSELAGQTTNNAKELFGI